MKSPCLRLFSRRDFKQETMFLEEGDLIVETLGPGLVRRDICVQSKPHWGFVTKNGKKRLVPIPADLMNKLLAVKAKVRPSKLLFGRSLWKTRLPHP